MGFFSENKTMRSPLKTIISRSLTIMLKYRKVIYTRFHGKRIFMVSGITCLIFLLSILTPKQVTLMEVTHRRPYTVIFAPSYFHDSSDGKSRETFPAFDPSTVHSSNPEKHAQNQDFETATDLRKRDISEQTSLSQTWT